MSFTYRKDVLENGIRIVSETSNDANSVALGFWVGVGSRSEPQDLSGISHFIEHLLFKGTRRRSAFEIAHTLESVGGSLDAFAGRESTAFVGRCLPEHLRRAIDVLSDMLCHPAMKDEAIRLEKQVVIEEIRNFEDTPEEIVHELLGRSVWRTKPIGNSVLGTVESVSNLRRDVIRRFFREHYVASNTIVAAAGRVDHAKLVEYVAKMLKLPRNGRPVEEPEGKPLPRVHHEAREVAQCYITMGVEAPSYVDKRRYAAILLSLIVGGGMTSRLFQEVRERKGLAYSVYCSCEFYRETGILTIFLAVDPKKARKAVRSVSTELSRLLKDGLARGELKSAKQQLKGNLILGLESTAARMSRIARHEFYLGEYISVEKSLEEVMGVTADKVMAEAKRLFKPQAFSLVVVGPPSTDFPQETDLDF